jgi:putative endonuclease
MYFIYILTNQTHTTLYTGVTNDLVRRIYEHKQGLVEGFTKKYQCKKLVYYEVFEDAYNAIVREKQIKAGSRAKKLALIGGMNPNWKDMYAEII